MTRYKCERRSQIRAGPELTSDKVAILERDTVVVALDTLKLPSGTVRIQFARGWVSEATKTGLKVMSKLEDDAEDAAAPTDATSAKSEPNTRRPRSKTSLLAATALEKQPTGVSITTVVPAHRIAHHRHGPHMVSRMIETFQTGEKEYAALDTALSEEQQVTSLLGGGKIVDLHALYHDLDIDHSGAVDVEDVAPMIDSADLEAQELIRIADDDESGTLTFFEFGSVYLNAITGGKLSHHSDGFVDILSDVERHVNMTQIASVAEQLVQACRNNASGSQLSHTLQELRKMLHEVEGGQEIHDQGLSNQAARGSAPGGTQVDIDAIELFENELDLEVAEEEQEILHAISEQEAVDAVGDAFRPMTPGESHPGTGVGPVHRTRLRTNWNPKQQAIKEQHRHEELARLYGLFPTIDSATIDSILDEAGSIAGALQVLKDITGATDEIESKAIAPEVARDGDVAPAPAPSTSPNEDDVKIAQGVEEFALPSDPANLEEALEQFVAAQHVNQVDAAWKHVKALSGIPPDVSGLTFFNQLKDIVATCGRTRALQITSLLETKVSRRKEFCKLSGQTACVIGAGPVGLRCAVELAMCGASVVVIEQRRAFTRANILKLWPFLVHDLRTLGAKIFFPQFCTGGLMHIGTRRLQQILLKDALLLGVEVHYGLQFHKVHKPDKAAGRPQWNLSLGPMVGRDGKPRDSPELHAAAEAEAAKLATRGFDSFFVGIGQQSPVETQLPNGDSRLSFTPILETEDGKVPLFELKKVQYSQAVGMVTHFKNNCSIDENTIQEQGGIARQFNMEMFESLQRTTMCELENVVYYRGETHYWVMTPTIESLEKTGVLEKVAPTRDALLAESSEEMQALLRFCFSHINCGEIIDVTHGDDDDDDDDVGLFDLVEQVMAAREGPEIIKRKVLWRRHIDDSQGSPRFHTHDMALTGKLSAKAQSKALAGLADDLMRIVLDEFPKEKWPTPPAGSRLFKTHGRRGEGSTYIVNNQKMMSYARHVAGHFRPHFKKKDPATGEFVAQFTSVAEGAQIFNFDQILEAKTASKFLTHDGVACSINLTGDSLKEPFWPQGTGVNRGILGAFDAIYVLTRAAGQDLTQEAVRNQLFKERETLQTECFRADTPYEKDGVMVSFRAKGKQGGSFTLDPKTRYIRIKHAR